NLRPDLFRRLQLCRQRPGGAEECAGGLQACRCARGRNDRGPPGGRGLLQFARLVEQLRCAIRQQDRRDMSMTGMRRPHAIAAAVSLLTLSILLAAGLIDSALAQGSPFGVGRPPTAAPPPAAEGVVGWIMTKQAEFYRALSSMIRAA